MQYNLFQLQYCNIIHPHFHYQSFVFINYLSLNTQEHSYSLWNLQNLSKSENCSLT